MNKSLLSLAVWTVGSLVTLPVYGQNYTMAVVTSDGSVSAPHIDPNLVNPWGLSRSSSADWWVSDAGTGKSTLYDGSGTTGSLVVAIPSGSGSGPGLPSGTIYNGSPNFEITPGNPAVFLFSTLDGTISGWSPNVDSANAKILVNNPGAVYSGLTSATFQGAQYLYVPNFQGNAVEVYDSQLHRYKLWPHAFESILANHLNLRPFNVQNIGGNVYVAYARQSATGKEQVGAGLGAVAAFTASGVLIHEFEPGSHMNAPWGLALAPSDFGAFSHAVLVGQFGSGQVLAFNPGTGKLLGMLADANNAPIAIDGLWSISFGAGNSASGPFNTLYFTAGPNDEKNGIFGTLTPVASTLTQGNGQ